MGAAWQITGNDPMAHNAPGKEPLVNCREAPLSDVKDRLSVAPLSVTLFVLDVE